MCDKKYRWISYRMNVNSSQVRRYNGRPPSVILSTLPPKPLEDQQVNETRHTQRILKVSLCHTPELAVTFLISSTTTCQNKQYLSAASFFKIHKTMYFYSYTVSGQLSMHYLNIFQVGVYFLSIGTLL